ncbi:MAG TPA: hypothetical protein VHA71_07985 [Rhodanobacteraceae bacterium]|nr:hypothetical protein [Rhodanobacteraceae bacterium]
MLQHVVRHDDLRATTLRIDHHVIRGIDIRAKQVSRLPYPRCGRLGSPWACMSGKQAHPDAQFVRDARERLWRQPPVSGLDQADQVTAVAFESEEAAQDPLGCGEGRRSGSGRRERFPMKAIADTNRAGTIELCFQV